MRVAVPDPLEYVAVAPLPALRLSVGVPAPVKTVTLSPNTTLMSMTAPALYAPFAAAAVTDEMAGAAVSTGTDSELLDSLELPTASVKAPACTEMDIGVIELTDGVNVIV